MFLYQYFIDHFQLIELSKSFLTTLQSNSLSSFALFPCNHSKTGQDWYNEISLLIKSFIMYSNINVFYICICACFLLE